MKASGKSASVQNVRSERLHYLDNLKVFLTLLVIAHHAGQPYGPTGGFWQYRSSLAESADWLGNFFAVNAAFFMGLFFMISGYFLPSSYDRKPFSAFVKEKFVRFGIPVLFVFTVLQPLEMFFHYIKYSGNAAIGFYEYYVRIFFGIGGMPENFISTVGFPEMNFGHLWFVEHLLVYSLLYALVRKSVLKKKAGRISSGFSPLHVSALIVLVTAASVVVRNYYPQDKWIGILGFFQAEPAHLPQYVILFLTGILAWRRDWFSTASVKTGYFCLASGVVMALIVYLHRLFPGNVINRIYHSWGVYESFMAVFLSWGLVILFREKMNSSSDFSRLLSENSYAAYIFHFPVLLAVQYSLDGIHIFGATGKFLAVTVISVFITYAFSILIRKIAFVRKVI